MLVRGRDGIGIGEACPNDLCVFVADGRPIDLAGVSQSSGEKVGDAVEGFAHRPAASSYNRMLWMSTADKEAAYPPE
jgi:hypothetical protein